MDIDFLRAFIVLSDLENVTLASEKLNMSPSALSSSLAKLEEEMDRKFFDRVNKRIRLNDNGRYFLRYAKKIVAFSDRAMEAIRESAEETGTIRVGVAYNTDTLLILLAAFHKEHPGIRVELRNERFLPEDWVHTDLDMAVVRASGERAEDSVRIGRWTHLFVLVRDGHPLCSREEVDITDLSEERFVFSSVGSDRRRIEWVYDYCVRQGFRPRVSYLCEGFDGKLELVANTDAVALVHNTLRGFREGMRGIRAIPVRVESQIGQVIELRWRSEPINPLANKLADFAREFDRRGRDAYI